MTPLPQNLTSVAMPAAKISAPQHVQWHMIMDSELDMLADHETGVIGALGFTAIGGLLGGAVPFLAAVDKIGVSTVEKADVVAVAIFVGCAVAAIICIGIFALKIYRNESLKTKIRNRGMAEPARSPFTGPGFTFEGHVSQG